MYGSGVVSCWRESVSTEYRRTCVPVSEVPGRLHMLPDIINYQFRELVAALVEPVHFLSPGQQSGIHCLITCAIQLSTPNN